MLRLAIMGATGAVGQEFIKVIEQRNFQFDALKLLASSRSAGKPLTVCGKSYIVDELNENSFNDVDLVLASAGGGVSLKFAPIAAARGAVVVDNTSAFRMDKDVPLVVPEVNEAAAKNHKGIISNPNCSTIQMVVALNPIHKESRIKRLVISTYQSTSGKGARAMQELLDQTRALLNGGGAVAPKEFPHPIAFNCLPHIDSFLDNGYTREEMKMVNETRKIMGDDRIQATATTVRVPVLRGHAETVNVETESEITPERIRELLRNAPGVEVVDDPSQNLYPLQIHAAGKDATYVGRIRKDFSQPNTVNLWIVSDNLRKGAALNAVQIAESLVRNGWLKQ